MPALELAPPTTRGAARAAGCGERSERPSYLESVRRMWDSIARAVRHRGTAVFIALAVAVGVVVGLAASALIGGIAGLEAVVEWLGDETGSMRTVVLVAVPAGIFVAWLIARLWAPEVEGDGVPEATAALAVRSGHLPSRSAPWKIIATVFTLGPGGSGGREGPIVQVGSSIGSAIARHTGLGEDRIRSLVAAGAGAAIGASFNAPIAGMLFAMEVILGNFAVRHLNAVVVSSVAAAVTTRSIVGEERILRAFPHRVDDARELLLYAALGILAALVGWLFLRLLDLSEGLPHTRRTWLRPVLFGLAVGAIAWFEPEVLGTGQDFVRSLLNTISVDSLVWYTLLGIGAAKLVATALTLGSGGSAGAFMPSLFLGAVLGALFTDAVQPVWNISTLEPGAFAVVGMAATFAAVARAPLTSMLIVFEITQDYALVLPLMLATSLATFLGDRVHRESVYTMALARRGIRLSRRSEVDLLDTVTVGAVIKSDSPWVPSTLPTADVQRVLDQLRLHGIPVVDDGRLVGVVTITDLVRTGGPSDTVTAAEAMTPNPVTATPTTPVSDVLQRMAALGVGRIPVVAEEDPERLVGVFRREDAVRAYHMALGQEVDHDLGRSRLQARVDADADFHEVTIPVGSAADGRLVKEIPFPSGATLVSVRRGMEVLVPDGNLRLSGGDIITVFARSGTHEMVVERLRAGDTVEMEALAGGDAARFFDLEIPVGSPADGRTVRDLAVPAGCTVVSVRREADVIVPDGKTVLLGGDVITVFARPSVRNELAERMRQP